MIGCKAKDLLNSTDFCVSTELFGGAEMATITLNIPELDRMRKKYPHINWNEVLKRGILKRLEELKKFALNKDNWKYAF